jgi:hypothetical protein
VRRSDCYDADQIVQAIAGALPEPELAEARAHLEGCAACRRVATIHRTARETWRAAVDRDALAAPLREARLGRGRPATHGRVRSGRAISTVGAFAAVVAALAIGYGWGAARHAPDAGALPGSTVAQIASVIGSAPVTASSASVAPPSRRPRIVALRGCDGCTTGGRRRPIRAGMILPEEETFEVPARSLLPLAFAVDERAVDPAAGVDVDGPARVRIAPGGIALERGRARAFGEGTIEIAVPGGAARGARAVFRVEVIDGTTRLEVIEGDVSLSGADDRSAMTAHAGERLELRGGHVRSADAPRTSTDRPVPVAKTASSDDAATTVDGADAAMASTPAEILAEARAALRDGDRVRAAALLRALSLSSDLRVREQANFTLAQIELATLDAAARARGRDRLEPLLSSSDGALACDAAFLVSRHTKPEEREAVWATLLKGRPPSPCAEHAAVELADARLSRGDLAGARSALANVPTSGLPAPVQTRVDRLRTQLAK